MRWQSHDPWSSIHRNPCLQEFIRDPIVLAIRIVLLWLDFHQRALVRVFAVQLACVKRLGDEVENGGRDG